VLERGFTNAARAAERGDEPDRPRAPGARQAGWRRFKAYADVAAGETGAIYRAAGFQPCGPTKHGTWRWRYALMIGGKLWSDRAIYRRCGNHAAARAAGAMIIKVPARVAYETA
jgi:hypothetical protein